MPHGFFGPERRRFLQYPIDSPRTFVLPFQSIAHLRDAKFALEGIDTDERYSWERLMAHVVISGVHEWVLAGPRCIHAYE